MEPVQDYPSGNAKAKRAGQANPAVQIKRQAGVIPPDSVKHTFQRIGSRIFQYCGTNHTCKKYRAGIWKLAAQQDIQYGSNAVDRAVWPYEYAAVIPFEPFDAAVGGFVNPAYDTIQNKPYKQCGNMHINLQIKNAGMIVTVQGLSERLRMINDTLL